MLRFGCDDACGLNVYGNSGGGEIVKSCSIIVNRNVSVLNFIFHY